MARPIPLLPRIVHRWDDPTPEQQEDLLRMIDEMPEEKRGVTARRASAGEV